MSLRKDEFFKGIQYKQNNYFVKKKEEMKQKGDPNNLVRKKLKKTYWQAKSTNNLTFSDAPFRIKLQQKRKKRIDLK